MTTSANLLVEEQHILNRYRQLRTTLEDEARSAQDQHKNLNGTIRAVDPLTTLAKLKTLLPKFGITRVANVTGLDNIDVPVMVAIRPNSKHLSTSQGKSLDFHLAQISAIMESVEGYHMENPPEPELIGSYEDLIKEYPLVEIEHLMGGQFAHEHIKKLKMRWIGGINLINNELIYVPHAVVNLNSSQINDDWAHLMVSSNGLASGNTLSEAICHGLYEVIERDSVSRWLAQAAETIDATLLDQNTIDCPRNREILDKLSKANISVFIWEATSALNIPTFYAMIKPREALGPGAPGSYYGCGTHLLKDIALSRALTEAIQSRATLISGSRDDIFPEQYEKQKKNQNLSLANFITGSEKIITGQRDYKVCASPQVHHSFHENIKLILQCLQQYGCSQVIVMNHTKAEFKVPVTQIIIPGMQFNGFRI